MFRACVWIGKVCVCFLHHLQPGEGAQHPFLSVPHGNPKPDTYTKRARQDI